MPPYSNWNYEFNTLPDQFNYYSNESGLTAVELQRQRALEGPPELASANAIYNSYAGVDIVAQIVIPGEAPVPMGELQTISYSIHRENAPVRVLGHTSPVGFIKGGRTIAGSMIFTVFNNYAFYRLKQFQKAIENRLYPVADMLPPFDIVLTFANEFGVFSKMKIYGVTFIDEGGTMSVDDLITEQTYQYMARGIQPMTGYVMPEYASLAGGGGVNAQ